MTLLAVAARLALIAAVMLAVALLVQSGAGWAVLVIALLAARLFRRHWPGSGMSHGVAAFATRADARAADLTTPGSGLHLGNLAGGGPPAVADAIAALLTAPLADSPAVLEDLAAALGKKPPAPVRLWAHSFAHASIFGASRSGKGAGIIVPSLLTYPGPVLCIDPKGELYTLTAERRRSWGRRVLVIDPYRVVSELGGETYNPMGCVSPDDPFVPDIAKDFATSLVTRTGQERERFFPDASEHLIQAVIAATLWAADEDQRHLVTVADILADPKLLAHTLASMQQSDAYGGVLRTLGHQAAQLDGREKASVLASITQYLGFLNSQPVRATVRDSRFDTLWLKSGADLFLVLPPEKLRSASGFTRYLLTGLLRRLAQGAPDESNPILVVIDEAAALGQLQILEDAVTLFAGWGLKLVFVWQSVGQLQDCFPGEKARTFLANMSLQVFAKTNDLETAKLISERIGDTTVLTTSAQEGGGMSRPVETFGGGPGGAGQRSTSWGVSRAEHGHRLIRPEEVLALPPEFMVVFSDRSPRPLLVKQVRFYAAAFWDFCTPPAWRVTAVLRVLVLALGGFFILYGLIAALDQ